MSADLHWEEHVKGLPAASETDLARVEHALGVRFPDDFRALAPAQQGRIPSPRHLPREGRPPLPFGPLFHFAPEDTHPRQQGDALLFVAGILREDGYPPQIVPFASSGGGSNAYFAFDFRGRPEAPSVVFVDPDRAPEDPKALMPVAESFTALLGKLRPA